MDLRITPKTRLNGSRGLRVGSHPHAVHLAVVGLGYWGPNLLRVLAGMSRSQAQVKWLCDLEAGRLAHYQALHPALMTTLSLDEVLADPDIDAVLLATPVSTHAALAERSLDAGKHVFVEKPLASSLDQADLLLSKARQRGLVLMCGHTFLYSPPVRYVHKLVQTGELGDIYFISASRVNLGLHQRDASVVWDLAPHDFSILLYWLGERPASVRALGRDSIAPGIPDVAFVTLTFPSGVVANLELSWLSPSKLRRTVVAASNKMVIYEDGSGEAVRIFDHGVDYEDPQSFGEYQFSYRTGDIVSPRLESYEPLTAELGELVKAIQSGRADNYRLEIARNVVALTEAADHSLRTGGVEIELSEQQRSVAG